MAELTEDWRRPKASSPTTEPSAPNAPETRGAARPAGRFRRPSRRSPPRGLQFAASGRALDAPALTNRDLSATRGRQRLHAVVPNALCPFIAPTVRASRWTQPLSAAWPLIRPRGSLQFPNFGPSSSALSEGRAFIVQTLRRPCFGRPPSTFCEIGAPRQARLSAACCWRSTARSGRRLERAERALLALRAGYDGCHASKAPELPIHRPPAQPRMRKTAVPEADAPVPAAGASRGRCRITGRRRKGRGRRPRPASPAAPLPRPGRDAAGGSGSPRRRGEAENNSTGAHMAELRSVDPRSLVPNPDNPRRTRPAGDGRAAGGLNQGDWHSSLRRAPR